MRASAGSGSSPRAVLLRHFLAQFASFESLSASGELKPIVIAVLSLLAAPGYYVAVMAVHGNPVRLMVAGARQSPYLWLWSQEWVLFACSLAAVAVFVAVQWESFVLRGRDFRILGVLPLRRRTVITAKLASLVAVVAGLHLAVNLLAGLVLPIASPFGYLRSAAALQLALLAQSLFACGAIVAAQALVSFALPLRLAQRASSLLQACVLLGVAFLMVTEGAISRLAYAMHDRPHAVNVFVPVAWFVGLYECLLGATDAEVVARARLAVWATAASVAVALPGCLLGYRDAEGREGVAWPRWRRIGGTFMARRRPPVARAVCSFVAGSLVRCPLAALIARAWFVLGVAFSLSGLVGLLWTARGQSASVIPSAPVYAPAILLPFFGLVGLRLSASFPVWLEANWLFRLSERPGSPDYAAGVRAAALRTVVLPVLALLAVPYAVVLGPWPALAHLVFALAVALVTIEWLFFGFARIPFTCSYQPGKANLRASWPKYAAIGLLYCGVLPAVANRALARPLEYLVVVAVLFGLRQALVAVGDQRIARGEPLAFEDEPPAYVTRLGLDD